MDPRREHISKWVPRLPDIPARGKGERTRTPGRTGKQGDLRCEREDRQIHPREVEMYVDPPMEEALRIYKSHIWTSKNFGWLFSEEVPDWLDTDPEDWPDVRRILQEFKHRDFTGQFSRAKKKVEREQRELNDSDSRDTDSYDHPAVVIVVPKDTHQHLKPCLKIHADRNVGSNIIKMVIMGSVDIELFPLAEEEIDWKNISLSLERIEVNGRYIRDISKREMDVRKLYELGLYTTSSLEGDDSAAVESRRKLCELYNQKLQSQLAENDLQTSLESVESKFPLGDELTQRTGLVPDLVLQEAGSRFISPHRSTKQSMLARMKDANRPQSRCNQSNCDDRGINKCKSVLNLHKTGHCGQRKSEPMIAVSGKRPTDELPTITQSVTVAERTTGTVKEKKREAHGKPSDSQTAVKSLDDPLDDIETKTDTKLKLSCSEQSLDDLLDAALEEEEKLERRRAEKSVTQIRSQLKQESSFDDLQITDTNIMGGDSIRHGHTDCEVDKQADRNNGFQATLSLSDEGLQNAHMQGGGLAFHDCAISTDLKQDHVCCRKSGLGEIEERPKSRRGCVVPQKLLETQCESLSNSSLDNDVQVTEDLNKDLPPSRCWSSLTLFSELSTDDWSLLRQRNPQMSKSNAINTPEVNSADQERSSHNSPSCVKTAVIGEVRSKDKQFLSFARRQFSSLRKKLRSINCFSNST